MPPTNRIVEKKTNGNTKRFSFLYSPGETNRQISKRVYGAVKKREAKKAIFMWMKKASGSPVKIIELCAGMASTSGLVITRKDQSLNR